MAETDDKIIYPKLLDDYFKNNKILIKQIPNSYRLIKQEALNYLQNAISVISNHIG